MEIKVTDSISAKDKHAILQELIEYNLSKIEDTAVKALGAFIEDEQGKKIAGLVGETHGKWFEIDYLWVDEALRGQGIGADLVKKAEHEAKKRGCQYVFLNTFDFQAPAFYKKLGYSEVFVQENYPVTGKRYYFTKLLKNE